MRRIGIQVSFWLTALCLASQPVWAAGAKLEFVPSSLTLTAGETKAVDVMVSPNGNQVVGVDLIIQFDPTAISLQQITNRGAFPTQLGTQIDNSSGTAKVAFSNPVGVYLTNPATVAEIVLTGKNPTANTALTFSFIAGKTNDTNVVIPHGQDSLTTVGPLTLTVTDGTSASPGPDPTPTPSPGATPIPTPTSSIRPRPSSRRPSPRPTPTPRPRPSPRRGGDEGEDRGGQGRGRILGEATPTATITPWFGWWLPVALVAAAGVLFLIVFILHKKEQRHQSLA